jgi:hypothetical protein
MNDVAKIRCPYCDIEILASATHCWMCRGELENGQRVVQPVRERVRESRVKASLWGAFKLIALCVVLAVATAAALFAICVSNMGPVW